ncbi:hypothetical protein [Massilia sp. TWR1-2-2]|uniref:hypothetical protein n=1 Tax=Massilia sp. TWR1-2-2 TaxID=2804584 RepID=UPI003CF93103
MRVWIDKFRLIIDKTRRYSCLFQRPAKPSFPILDVLQCPIFALADFPESVARSDLGSVDALLAQREQQLRPTGIDRLPQSRKAAVAGAVLNDSAPRVDTVALKMLLKKGGNSLALAPHRTFRIWCPVG